jgi:DNA polymerase-3 subunit epsilon
MNIQLDRPIAVFDLETTGINISQDKIIEIAILKIHPDGNKEKYEKRVNPGIKMEPENMAIHGITNEDLADCPSFSEVATEIKTFIEGCDFGGFNSNKFDVPLLVEEMLRVDESFDISDRKFVDVQNIFHKMEKRTLEAAYKFYCDKPLINAHSALADAEATWEILNAQIERYESIAADVDFLSDFSLQHDNSRADFAGRLAKNSKEEVLYNFGKNRGKTVEQIHKSEPGYYGWLMGADFPLHTKQVLKKEMDRIKYKTKKQKLEKAAKEAITESDLDKLKNKFN